MMLTRKMTYALLGALLTFNILLRYPTTGHEGDVDSFFIHALAGAILAHRNAAWAISPLSYFGWYPLSYPSAGPFILADISGVSGQSVETSILVMTLGLGPLGTLGAFMMARELRAHDGFALSAALLYGLAPRFLSITLWTGSTRNLFTALLPFLIWALLRTYRRGSPSAVGILFTTLVTLAATHRLVVLILVVIASFLAAVLVQTLLRVLRTRFPELVLRNSVRGLTPHLALVAVVCSATITLFGTNVLQEYSQGEVVSGSDLPTQLANLSISIARSAGLALPLMFVGLVVMTRQRAKTIAEPFLAIALLGLVPTLFMRKYTGFYILPFLAAFGGLGIMGILRLLQGRRRTAIAAGVAIVVATATFSVYVLGVEFQRIPFLDDDTYNTALFVRMTSPRGTMIANDGLMGVRVGSVAGVGVLPVGGAGTTFANPELLAYGFYSRDEVAGQLVQVPLTELTIESDSFWTVPRIQAELDWVEIMQSPLWAVPQGLSDRYSPGYYLESNSAAGNFVAYNNVYCSNLARSAHEFSYLVYDNGQQSIWWLYSPAAKPSGSFIPCT